MSNLFEITSEMARLESLLDQSEDDEGLDEAIGAAIEDLSDALGDKLDNCDHLLRRWAAMTLSCKEERARLAEREKRLERRTRRLKGWMVDCLHLLNDPHVETDLHTYNLRKGVQRVVVDDERLVPPYHFKTKVERVLDKRALLSAAKIKDVPGVHLERGPDSVVIK